MLDEPNPKRMMRARPFNSFFAKRHFSNRLVLSLSFLIILLVMFQGLASSQLFWKVGDVATRTITADRSVVVEDKEATQAKQERVLTTFEDVYETNLDQFNNLTLVAIDRAFDELRDIVASNEASSEETAEDTSATSESATADTAAKEEETKRHEQLNTLLNKEVSDADWKVLMTYTADDIDLLHRQAVAISSNVMGKGVKEEELTQAKEQLLDNVDQSFAFSDLDRRLVHRILENTKFYATSAINLQDSEAKRKELVESVEPVFYTIQKDQVVVNKGDIVTEEQYAAVQALSNKNDSSPYKIMLGLLLAVLAVYATIYHYAMWRGRNKTCRDWRQDTSIVFTCMTIIVVLLPCVSAVQFGATQSQPDLINFLIPVPAFAIMVSILIDNEMAIFATMALNILVGVYTGDVFVSFAGIAGSIAALGQVKLIHRRTDLTMSGVWAAAAVALVALCYFLVAGLEVRDLLFLLGFAVGNGVLTLLLTIGVLPYLESAFKVTTSLTLMELCDPNTPLQRELMRKCPGTFQHSLMVANLAEAAALRIGADAQLVRTAAYYHDIGKTKMPAFFSENQVTEENPHDKISPSLSLLIITSHVKEGVAIAKEARLPQPIIDLIAQHHGNTVVGYFYYKALKKDPETKKDEFRYKAQRPQSREAAILMIADTVEAAVRSNISRLSRNQVDNLIRNLVNDKFEDGQFNECAITYRDLNEITDEMVRMMNSIYHKRVAYPDKKSLMN